MCVYGEIRQSQPGRYPFTPSVYARRLERSWVCCRLFLSYLFAIHPREPESAAIRVAAGRGHPALLGEHAHAAGGLAFQVLPGARADATGDQHLGVGVREFPRRSRGTVGVRRPLPQQRTQPRTASPRERERPRPSER